MIGKGGNAPACHIEEIWETKSSAPFFGGIAQLVERYDGIVNVGGASPLISTNYEKSDI